MSAPILSNTFVMCKSVRSEHGMSILAPHALPNLLWGKIKR